MSRRLKKERRPEDRGSGQTAGAHAATLWTRDRITFLAVGGLLLLAVIVAYQPALTGGILWDDDMHVTRPELRSWHGLYRIWFDVGATLQYYPLLHSAFWLEQRLWGDATLGYHVANVLLHVAAALMAALVLRRLKIPGAYLAAAVFALHPIQVESVAWITEQKNTLSAVFYLGSLLAYVGFDETRKKSLYGWALGLFVLGVLTKTIIATLPGAVLVILWWQRGRLSWRRDVLPLVPFFVLGAGGGMITAWWELQINQCVGPDFTLTLVERCLIAGRTAWFLASKLLWPTQLTFIYPRWSIDAGVGWQYAFPLGACAVLAALWSIRRWTRGPLAGVLFFGGTLFPMLGFFNLYTFRYSFVANHYQYLAGLGIIVLAAAGAALLLERHGWWNRPSGYVLCLVPLVILGGLTRQQSGVYADVERLYGATIAENPDCWMAHNNLGFVLAERGQYDAAIAHYRTALEIKPDHAKARVNLINALYRVGRADEAAVQLQKVMETAPEPADVRYNVGLIFYERGRTAEAVDQWSTLVGLQPENIPALNQLAWVLATNPAAAVRNGAAAVELARRAVGLTDGRQAAIVDTLAAAYAEAGRYAEAVETAQRALALASGQNNAALAKNLRARIRLYEAGSPYREARQPSTTPQVDHP